MTSSTKLIQAASGVGGGDFYPYTVDNSCRFNKDDNAYLARTQTAGNSKTFTISAWVKRCYLTDENVICGADTSGSNRFMWVFNAVDLLQIFDQQSGVVKCNVKTTAVFRDPSAWYHIVLAVDTTQGTAANRVKIYINGVEQVQAITTSPALNQDLLWNTAIEHRIGSNVYTSAEDMDGYMAEFAHIEDSQLTATSFGEFKNGIWVPKSLTGLTFGSEGFLLDFANSAALGNDVSGNNNDFTPSGLAASDQMIDTPTNNFATLNPLWQINLASATEAALSDGNLTSTTATNAQYNNSVATMPFPPTGKWYCEVIFTGTVNSAIYMGVIAGLGQVPGATYNVNNFYHAGDSSGDCGMALAGGTKRINQVNSSYGSAVASGSVIQVAVDMDNNKIWFGDDGTYMASGDPAAGTNYASNALVDEVFLVGTSYTSGDTYKVNFGQTAFAHTPPTDFLALSTANFPEPTIGPNSTTLPSEVFATVLYTGNGTVIGSGGLAVTGVGFQPDMVWIKNRDAADQWMVFDSVRGVTKYWSLDSPDIEVTDTETLSTFDADGFTLGSNLAVNTNTEDYVAFCFKITAGFFDIQSYSGTGVAKTEAHDLGVVPSFNIVKNLTVARSPRVYCESLPVTDPETDRLLLDGDQAVTDSATTWNDTAPTSAVITVGTDAGVNEDTEEFIVYLFANMEGLCKVGYYEGNGNADGPFAYQGFLPDFVMLKRTDVANSWVVTNGITGPTNPDKFALRPNLPNAEDASALLQDYLSNGVKAREAGAGRNASGGDYITLSIGTSFKYSNAR
jgi:hypothetical protein